jgi:osmotically-inducible protein OsmY
LQAHEQIPVLSDSQAGRLDVAPPRQYFHKKSPDMKIAMKINRSSNMSAAVACYADSQVNVSDAYIPSGNTSHRIDFLEVRPDQLLDQSSAQADDLACARIREMIAADKSLSLYAHNIEVAAVSGRMILKGVVKSELEKQKIASEAAAIVSEDTIVNNLVIRSKQAGGQSAVSLSQAEEDKSTIEQECSSLRNLWGIRYGRGSSRLPAK